MHQIYCILLYARDASDNSLAILNRNIEGLASFLFCRMNNLDEEEHLPNERGAGGERLTLQIDKITHDQRGMDGTLSIRYPIEAYSVVIEKSLIERKEYANVTFAAQEKNPSDFPAGDSLPVPISPDSPARDLNQFRGTVGHRCHQLRSANGPPSFSISLRRVQEAG